MGFCIYVLSKNTMKRCCRQAIRPSVKSFKLKTLFPSNNYQIFVEMIIFSGREILAAKQFFSECEMRKENRKNFLWIAIH
jgi:hypothetical protein